MDDNQKWAQRLGYAGLIPFVLGAALVWVVSDEAYPYVTLALSAYGAVIVSFLGGIYWGVAFQQPQPQPRLWVWGVVPSLLAWVGVMMPPESGMVVLGAVLLLCYAVDRHLYPPLGLSRWLVLRFRLSAVAALSCFLGAAGA
ncbi:MAG: DUF3429 domain-containing protein [Betaproteobacteria bacterium]|nr:DUF3429 domain-containing protein [Betaproteobacteria bacterium]